MDWKLVAERPVPRTLLALAALALAVALSVLWSDPARADTFTVKNTKDEGEDSLRAAITEANNHAGADEIRFDIPGATGVKSINLASELPTITDPVTIDGYTQPGTSPNTLATGNNAVLLIQLMGTNAGEDAAGLEITGSDSAIKGLVINRFGGDGIVVSGSGATGNRIEGNFMGTTAAGTATPGNNDDGVDI